MTSNVENESFINKFKNVRLDALLVDKKFVSSRKEGCLSNNDRRCVCRGEEG